MTEGTRTCTHPGCDRPYDAKGYCHVHYRRWRNGKPMDAPMRVAAAEVRNREKCSVWDCDKRAAAKGKCRNHYMRDRKKWYVSPNPCSVDDCERPREALGMCSVHYNRFRTNRPLDLPIIERRPRGSEGSARKLCTVLTCMDVPGDDGTCDLHRGDHSQIRYRRTMMVNGYVEVLVGSEHPSANSYGGITEHRLMLELKIGRTLVSPENVHHRNGIRHDNRPDNLELWRVRQPPGQRVTDLLAWAHELIRTYEGTSGSPAP